MGTGDESLVAAIGAGRPQGGLSSPASDPALHAVQLSLWSSRPAGQRKVNPTGTPYAAGLLEGRSGKRDYRCELSFGMARKIFGAMSSRIRRSKVRVMR